MAHPHPEPMKLFEDLLRLDKNYGESLEAVVAAYPTYAAQPGAPGASELFTEDSAELQTSQADLFMYRGKLDAASTELAKSIASREEIISRYDATDKTLSKQLSELDMQVSSADGRLKDAIYLYQEAYLANALLGLAVLGGAVGAYHSMKAVSAT